MTIKIRDFRNKQFFQVDDEYLNGYAKLCGISATGVYLSLCRHANKEQSCFPSKDLIAKELDISERTVYSAIKKLQEWNIVDVQDQGRKKDGSFNNHTYLLLDKSEWKKKPQATVADGKKQHSPQANNDTTRRQPLPNKDTHTKYTHKKDTHIAETSSAIPNLLEDKQFHIRIIGLYARAKKVEFANKEQQSAFIKRNLRPAQSLTGYEEKKIIEVMKWLLDNADFKWTIETIGKYIDENLEHLSLKGKSEKEELDYLLNK